MKKVMRYEDNRKYWDRRWSDSGSDAEEFSNLDIYPVKYAEMVMVHPAQEAIELGAGLGRVVKHYHNKGFNIKGIERSEIAVEKLLKESPELQIAAGDVVQLPHLDNQFDVLLSFGVYHNVEEDFDKAIFEAGRVLKPGGRFCISIRPNNFEMNANEWYWRWKQRDNRHEKPMFHKWLLGEAEFARILTKVDLHATAIHRARNVSILYRINLLRTKSRDESHRRSQGYQLNWLGRILDKFLIHLAPSQFCNVLVYVGTKGA